jgi:uncharacterized sulfatase
MFRLPGKTQPRRDDESLASTIDLAPTILAACSFESPADLPGIDLLSQSRSDVYGEIFEHDEADIDNPHASLQYRWSIEGDWKLILPSDGSAQELYNVKSDPFEVRNLAGENRDAVRRLTEKLDQWWPLSNENR